MPVIVIKILCCIAIVVILYFIMVGYIFYRMDKPHSMAEITWNRMRPAVNNWIKLAKDILLNQNGSAAGDEDFSSMITEFQSIKKNTPRNAPLLNAIHQKVVYYTFDLQEDSVKSAEKEQLVSAWDEFSSYRIIYNNHVKRYLKESRNPISKKLIRLLRVYPLTELDE